MDLLAGQIFDLFKNQYWYHFNLAKQHLRIFSDWFCLQHVFTPEGINNYLFYRAFQFVWLLYFKWMGVDLFVKRTMPAKKDTLNISCSFHS